MENKLILLDTNVLIDYFRKTKKENTFFHLLSGLNIPFSVSVITHFEILRGVNEKQEKFWKEILYGMHIISWMPVMNHTALKIREDLKISRKSISFEDLLIASTALHFNYPLATMNEQHFSGINDLILITPKSIS